MKNTPSSRIPLILLLLLIAACAEKQDFDQYEDLRITPLAEAGLFYVESTESVINQSPVPTYYSEDLNFDAFAEAFVSERLLDGVITYEIENTTSKELFIGIDFLDEAGTVLDTEQFTIDPGPTAILRREVAYGGASGKSIDIIRNTSGLRISAENLGDTTSVSGLPDPKVILRSSAQFRIQLK